MELEISLSEKQDSALTKLNDNVTEELVFGGAKNGGKSFLGITYVFGNAMLYPGTHWFTLRSELNDLRKYTIPSIGEVFSVWGLPLMSHANFNGQDNVYTLGNGSKIFLLAGKYLPSDPLFERFGSMQMTGGWIEEGGEIHEMCYENIKLSIGRWLNDKYGILGTLLITCNPKKNWIYNDFYKPFKDKALPKNKAFIQSLVTDNIYRQKGSIERLDKIKDDITRQRLRYGIWEYINDPNALCDYDAIMDLFTNDHVQGGRKYISADLAMQGRDRFIAGYWDGFILDLTKGIDQEVSSGKGIELSLKRMMVENKVSRSSTIVDSDGIGSYLESYLNGIKEFRGGAKAKSNEYANLKSECAYKLVEVINMREMKIICSEEQKQYICQELELLKADSVDNDERKKRIIKKDQMKKLISRSPDYLDVMIMRMYFSITKSAYAAPVSHIIGRQ